MPNGILTLWGYFGSKAKLAERIADWLPYKEITTFVDAFTGSCAITLNKPSHKHQICNDLNIKIFLVIRALSEKETANEFIARAFKTKYSKECFDKAVDEWRKYDKQLKQFISEMLKLTEYTPEAFEYANNKWKTIIPEDKEIEMAVYALVIFRQSFNGLGKDWKGIKDGDEGVAYENRLCNLRDIAEKLEGTEVYNVNAIMLINKFKDRADVAFYNDSPYEFKTRGKKQSKSKHDYEIEMPDELQLKYIDAIKDAKEKIVLSGFKRNGTSIYDVLVEEWGWKCIAFAETKKSAAVTKSGEAKPVDVEYVWYNY
ncbi:MAG TPA: hypothetical protein DCP90_03075 [Clostridiales bacterium]|nr:MAG: hypothetical protein A2Y22_07450 [Clostridiales bacterium GWD2_32_59]HAN09577.1 hypothetical protein [Clostridiales bacterium]